MMELNRIGRFTLITEIGRSPIASVFMARDDELDREVAIKLFHSKSYSDPTVRARYQREVRIISTLEHPAIVPVFEFDELDDQPFIVMKWMPGGSLADLLAVQPLEIESAIQIIRRVADALDSVHMLGILHGDLKPSNILFDDQGLAYVSDFGMLKLAEATKNDAAPVILGPPAYISPEQAQGWKSIDQRSDIYMMGMLLFEMMTAKIPYTAETGLGYAVQKLWLPLQGLHNWRPDLPPQWNAAIKRALAREPGQRFASGIDFVQALQGYAVQDELPTEAIQVAQPPRWVKPEFDEKLYARSKRSLIQKASTVLITFLLSVVIVWLGIVVGVRRFPDIFQQPSLAFIYSNNIPLIPTLTQTSTPTLKPTLVFTATQTTAPTTTSSPSPMPSSTSTPTQEITVEAASDSAEIKPTTFVLPPSTQILYPATSLDTLFSISGKFNVGYANTLTVNAKACAEPVPIGVNILVPAENELEYSLFPFPFGVGYTSQLEQLRSLECMHSVAGIEFSPNNEMLAVAMGKSIFIWHVGDWRPLFELRGHISNVVSIDIDLTSSLLVSGSDDTSVKIWDLTNGTLVSTLYTHTAPIVGVGFIPQDSTIVSVSRDGLLAHSQIFGLIKTYQLESTMSLAISSSSLLAVGHERAVQILKYPGFLDHHLFLTNSPVTNLAFSPDSNLIASDHDVWHVQDMVHLYSISTASGGVDFSSDNQVLVIGGNFWDVSNGNQISSLFNTEEVEPNLKQNHISISKNGSLLAWGRDDSVTVWGLTESLIPVQLKSSIRHFAKIGDTLFNIASSYKVKLPALRELNGLQCTNPVFSSQNIWIPDDPESALQVIIGDQQVIQKENITQLQILKTMDQDCVLSRSTPYFSSDGHYLISGSAMWNVFTGGVVVQANDVPRRLDGKPDVNLKSPVLAFSPDDSKVAVRVGSVLQVWDTETGRLIRTLSGHNGIISSIAFTPDNKIVATGTGVDEQTIRIWDLPTGVLSFKIEGYVSEKLEYDSSGKYLYVLGSDTLRIYRSGEAIAYRTLRGVGSILELSPSTTSVAYTICTNGSGQNCRQHIAQIYFPETEVILRLIGTTGPIHDLAFSPDGNFLTAATGNGYLSWNVADSSIHATVRLEDSTQPITWLDYSPDGQMILGNESGKRLHIWDALTNTLIHTFDIEADWVAWSPDGKFIAVLNDDRIDVWGVNP